MRYSIIIFFSLLFSTGFCQKSNLTVTIKNIKTIKGNIQVGLYNKKELFPKVGKQFKVFYIKVTSKKIKYTIKDLDHGNYALAIFHDENSDNKCNRNFLGIPSEDYGFSNNVRPFLSPPDFEDAMVKLNKNTNIEVKLD